MKNLKMINETYREQICFLDNITTKSKSTNK